MTFGQLCMEKMIAEKKARGSLTSEEGAAIIDILDAERRIRNRGKPRIKESCRVRNPLFDALAMCTGCVNLEQLTRDGAKVVGTALADIKKVTPDVTVEEITRRAAAYSKKNPSWPLTAKSLAKYWGELGAKKLNTSRDPYVEPDASWRQVAIRKFPDAINWINPHDFQSIAWLNVSKSIREEILRVMAQKSD